ncbi:MAG: hypothetical protein AAF611_15185 [Bacteroidota bacterium]
MSKISLKDIETILNANTVVNTHIIKGGQTTEPDDCEEDKDTCEPAKPVVVFGSVKLPVGG